MDGDGEFPGRGKGLVGKGEMEGRRNRLDVPRAGDGLDDDIVFLHAGGKQLGFRAAEEGLNDLVWGILVLFACGAASSGMGPYSHVPAGMYDRDAEVASIMLLSFAGTFQ